MDCFVWWEVSIYSRTGKLLVYKGVGFGWPLEKPFGLLDQWTAAVVVLSLISSMRIPRGGRKGELVKARSPWPAVA